MAIMSLEAKVVEGHRRASGLAENVPEGKANGIVRMQKPYFEGIVPGIADIFDGTINVGLAPREFRILKPDYVVPDLNWAPGYTETFWFVSATLTHGGRDYAGWIYYPCPGEDLSHKADKDKIGFEFLAPEVEGLQYGDRVVIEYDSEKFEVIDPAS